MDRGLALSRAFVAGAILGLAGCASTQFEAPPEVVPQPEEITAEEAVAEGKAAEERDEAAAHGVTLPEEPASTPAPPAASASVASRQVFRPTERSVEEIRRQSATAEPPKDFGERLDQAHDRVYTWAQGLVEAADRKFADDDRELMPTPAAPFRLGAVIESVDRSDGFEFNLDDDLDIALRLPNIEQRLRIFITSDRLDEAPRVAGEDTSLSAGVRYRALKVFDFDLGVRLDIPPEAFASLRWQREYRLGGWDFYPFAKLFADTDQSVGYAGAVTFDRWSGRHLLRSTTYTKWRNDRDKNEWTQTLIYARVHESLVPERYGAYLKANDIGRGWGMRLLANSAEGDDAPYYEASLFYRRPTSNHWLFWYVEPLVRWDRDYDWNADPGIRIGVNMLFWDLARPAR